MPAVFLSLRTPFFACPEPPECDRRRVLFSPRPTASTTSAETWVRLRAWHRLGAWDVRVELVSVKAGEIQLAPSKGSPHRLHGRLTQRDASSSISSASRKPAAKTKTLRARRRHLRASHRGFNVTQTHGRLCTRGLGVKWMMETPAGVQAHFNGGAGRGGKGPGHPARFRASANLGPLYRRVGAGGHSSASRGFRLHEFCDGSSRARPPLLQNAPAPSRFSHEPLGPAGPPAPRCVQGRVLVPQALLLD